MDILQFIIDNDMYNNELNYSIYNLYINKFMFMVLDNSKTKLIDNYLDNIFYIIKTLYFLNNYTDILQAIIDNDTYLYDIILLLWCIPQKIEYNGNNRGIELYKNNIINYNCMISNSTIKNHFISESIRGIFMPIHCITFFDLHTELNIEIINNTSKLENFFFLQIIGDTMYLKLSQDLHKYFPIDTPLHLIGQELLKYKIGDTIILEILN